jgi:hypothetical protein
MPAEGFSYAPGWENGLPVRVGAGLLAFLVLLEDLDAARGAEAVGSGREPDHGGSPVAFSRPRVAPV